jgi:branched-subunit amino acid ABC-type transport system permease component
MVESQTIRLGTGDRIAIAVGISASAVGIAAVAFEHAYPDASAGTWRIILFASVALAIVAIFYLIFDLVIRQRLRSRPPIRATMAVLLVIAALSIGGWYVASITPHERPSQPPPTKEPTFATFPYVPRPATASIPQPNHQLWSRGNKFIFACDVPPDPNVNPAEQAKKKAELQKSFKAWGEVTGFNIVISDIEGGYRLTIQAKTIEAQNRLLLFGVLPSVTTITIELRRIGDRIVVSVYADLPKELAFFSLISPDPTDPKILEGENNIDTLLGSPPGTCHLI